MNKSWIVRSKIEKSRDVIFEFIHENSSGGGNRVETQKISFLKKYKYENFKSFKVSYFRGF